MSNMFSGQTMMSTSNDQYFEDTTLSPSTAMFPPEMSAPFLIDHSHLAPRIIHQQSMSIDPYNQTFLSGPPSLSPASQGISALQYNHHSPPSSASPSSNFSNSATDDFLFANSLSNTDLDMLLFPSNNEVYPSEQSFYLPQTRLQSFDNPTYCPPQSIGLRKESSDTFNTLNASPVQNRRYSVSTESYVMPKMPYSNTANLAIVQPTPFQQLQPQWSDNHQPLAESGWEQKAGRPVGVPQCEQCSSYHVDLNSKF